MDEVDIRGGMDALNDFWVSFSKAEVDLCGAMDALNDFWVDFAKVVGQIVDGCTGFLCGNAGGCRDWSKSESWHRGFLRGRLLARKRTLLASNPTSDAKDGPGVD